MFNFNLRNWDVVESCTHFNKNIIALHFRSAHPFMQRVKQSTRGLPGGGQTHIWARAAGIHDRVFNEAVLLPERPTSLKQLTLLSRQHQWDSFPSVVKYEVPLILPFRVDISVCLSDCQLQQSENKFPLVFNIWNEREKLNFHDYLDFELKQLW